MNKTIEYYDKNWKEYCGITKEVDMSEFYSVFLSYVKHGGKILDLGSGCGRDVAYFKNIGYQVTALDASEKMCKYVQERYEIKAINTTFEEMNLEEKYDGIWACASLLHVDYSNIDKILNKLKNALTDDGVIYISLKKGVGVKEEAGRKFHFYTEDEINKIIIDNNLNIEKEWITERLDIKWINIVIKNI